MDQKPSIGRIVHFVMQNVMHTGEGVKYNAMAFVLLVNEDGSLLLEVHSPFVDNAFRAANVIEGNEVGQWHWPERV